MAATVSAAAVFPLSEKYGDPVEAPIKSLLKAEGALFAFEGFWLTRAYRTFLSVSFADSSDPSLGGAVIRHGEDLDKKRFAKVVPVAKVTIPITQLFARKGSGNIEIEIAHLDSPLARVWAEAILAIGEIEPAAKRIETSSNSLRAYAHGKAGVMGFSDRVVRASYSSGESALDAEATESMKTTRAASATQDSANLLQGLLI